MKCYVKEEQFNYAYEFHTHFDLNGVHHKVKCKPQIPFFCKKRLHKNLMSGKTITYRYSNFSFKISGATLTIETRYNKKVFISTVDILDREDTYKMILCIMKNIVEAVYNNELIAFGEDEDYFGCSDGMDSMVDDIHKQYAYRKELV